MVPQEAQAFIQDAIVSGQNAPLTGGNDLIPIKTKGSQATQATNPASVIGGSMRFCRVFDHGQVMPDCQLNDWLHICKGARTSAQGLWRVVRGDNMPGNILRVNIPGE